ncbi:MAG: hypothetical protein CMH54_15885 [Myxococcales bacterium]|nr:hypothetical protein [Myxococcales bacterium]
MNLRRTIRTLCALLLSAPFLTGGAIQPAQAEELLLDRVVAVVDGHPVTLYDVIRTQESPDLTALFQGYVSGVPGERTDRWAYERTLDEELFLKVARDIGIEATRDQAEQYFRRLQRENQWADSELESIVMELGFDSVAEIHRAIQRQLSIANSTRIKVMSRVQVPPKELEENYRRQYGDGKEDKIHIRQILIRVPIIVNPEVELELYRVAERIRTKIVGGELDFEEAARLHSASSDGKNGGDLGWSTRGTYQFDSTAFGLKDGEVSPVIRTFLGYHILRVDERKSVPIDSPDRLKRTIAEELFEKRFREARKDWLKQARDQMPIQKIPFRALFGANVDRSLQPQK